MSENYSTEPGQPIPEDDQIKNRGRYGKYWDKTANVRVRRQWYGWFILLAIVLVAVAAVDILVLDQEYVYVQYAVYGLFGLMILAALLMYFTRTNSFARVQDEQSSMEQALLQCPECKNIFELKQQHFRDHQRVSFSCPICGTYGSLPGIEQQPVKKRLPEGDVREYGYHCTSCKEDIRLGVFGKEDIHRSEFRACPHCGEKGTIEVIEKPEPLVEEDEWEEV